MKKSLKLKNLETTFLLPNEGSIAIDSWYLLSFCSILSTRSLARVGGHESSSSQNEK
jgi:hypothetical protein